MALNTVDLTLIHITPVGDSSNITNKPQRQVSSLLTSEVIVTQSGYFIYYTIMTLVQKHYHLSSTTVTGIPMKEEQNASSSANYDVELLHSAEAHTELNRTAKEDNLIAQSREIPTTTTITLKWCTPKTNNVELHSNSSAQRITPVDVNSRPSSCLTNFLLSGRSVLLEQPCKAGVKLISHMLTSHGGEIFIHALNTARSALEDPPSISEGCGGRVTDYRITILGLLAEICHGVEADICIKCNLFEAVIVLSLTYGAKTWSVSNSVLHGLVAKLSNTLDFGKFMKENRLMPQTPTDGSDETPVDNAFSRLERLTRKWPMTLSDTIVYNMSSLQPLLSLIVAEVLTEEDVRTCTMAIIDTLGMESRNDPLPVGPLASGRGKGPKREEQYRQMWSELEALVRAHSITSPDHKAVLDCLLKCKKSSSTENGQNGGADEAETKTVVKEEKSTVDAALGEFDRYQKMTVREKADFNQSDSDGGGPIKKFKPLVDHTTPKPPGGHNLLSLWTNQLSAAHSKRHCEFAGRLETIGNVVELYTHLNDNKADVKKEETSQSSSRSSTPNQIRS